MTPKRAEKVIRELVEACREAICWLPGERRLTPADRGAKCDTLGEAVQKILDAIQAAVSK
jgi:hypothetical protein